MVCYVKQRSLKIWYIEEKNDLNISERKSPIEVVGIQIHIFTKKNEFGWAVLKAFAKHDLHANAYFSKTTKPSWNFAPTFPKLLATIRHDFKFEDFFSSQSLNFLETSIPWTSNQCYRITRIQSLFGHLGTCAKFKKTHYLAQIMCYPLLPNALIHQFSTK